MDPGDQRPTESLDTAELMEMLASPGHSPADSVNQPHPSPLWQLAGSSAGAAFHGKQPQPLIPELERYLPLGWEHGEQWATEEFMEGMRLA